MIFLVFLLFAVVSAQVKNPCPDILKYKPLADGSDRWTAHLDVKAREDLHGVWVHVDLDEKADVLVNNFGELSTKNNQNFIIRKSNVVIPQDAVLSVTLIAKFGDKTNIPSVKRITINGFLVCPTRNNIPSKPPTVTNNNKNTLPDIDIRSPSMTSTENVPMRKKGDICGTVPQAVGLVYNGREADEGAWPWHVALMQVILPEIGYKCGGSIITKKFILTAAHCVTQSRTRTIIANYNFLIFFGLTKLSDIPPSTTTSTIANIIIHDQYDPEKYFNDIALIELPNDIKFTNFIRPVCLWAENDDQSSIVGKQGTVVGFGIDNKNATFSQSLNEAKMPIVSLETCRSTDDFYIEHTSDKTFCAGGVNDIAACRGDSGGGMIFPMAGTSGQRTIWQLRGVVSVTKKSSKGNDVCDTKNLIIFTDVAKHTSWIRKNANIS